MHKLLVQVTYSNDEKPGVGVSSQSLEFEDYATLMAVQNDVTEALVECFRGTRAKHAVGKGKPDAKPPEKPAPKA